MVVFNFKMHSAHIRVHLGVRSKMRGIAFVSLYTLFVASRSVTAYHTHLTYVHRGQEHLTLKITHVKHDIYSDMANFVDS